MGTVLRLGRQEAILTQGQPGAQEAMLIRCIRDRKCQAVQVVSGLRWDGRVIMTVLLLLRHKAQEAIATA